MKPSRFKESNKVLSKPSSMAKKECGSLPVFSDGKECISKWKMSWAERIHCLFRGYVWVRIRSGYTQPPIVITARGTEFNEPTGKS